MALKNRTPIPDEHFFSKRYLRFSWGSRTAAHTDEVEFTDALASIVVAALVAIPVLGFLVFLFTGWIAINAFSALDLILGAWRFLGMPLSWAVTTTISGGLLWFTFHEAPRSGKQWLSFLGIGLLFLFLALGPLLG